MSLNRWNRDINIPPGVNYNDPAAPWNEEDCQVSDSEYIEDIVRILNKAGYNMEINNNWDIYDPERCQILVLEDA